MLSRNFILLAIKTVLTLSFSILLFIVIELILIYSHIPNNELVMAENKSPYFSVRDSSAMQYVSYGEKVNCEGLWDKRRQRFMIEPTFRYVEIDYNDGYTLVKCEPVEEDVLGICVLLDSRGEQMFRKEKEGVSGFTFYTKDIIEYNKGFDNTNDVVYNGDNSEFFKLDGTPVNSYLSFYLTHPWLARVYGITALLVSIIIGYIISGRIANKVIAKTHSIPVG